MVTCPIRWPWRFDMRYRLCGGQWSHTSTAHINVDRGPQTSHYPMGMGHEEEFNDNITFRFGNGIGLVYRSTSRLPWLWELPSRGKTYWHLRFSITIRELDIDNSKTWCIIYKQSITVGTVHLKMEHKRKQVVLDEVVLAQVTSKERMQGFYT